MSTHGSASPAHWTDDLAMDLVHGLLSDAEEDAALEHATECAECEARFQRWATRHERDRIRHVRNETGPTQPRATITPLASHRARRGGLLALAAAAVLTLFVWAPWAQRGPNAEWLPAYSDDLRLRSVLDATAGTQLADGLEAYGQRDVRKAIELLSALELSGSLEHVRQLYLGNALTHRGRYEDAIVVLDGLAGVTLPEPWGDEGRWSLFVALTKSGDAERAAEILNTLAREQTAVGARARRSLEEQRDDN